MEQDEASAQRDARKTNSIELNMAPKVSTGVFVKGTLVPPHVEEDGESDAAITSHMQAIEEGTSNNEANSPFLDTHHPIHASRSTVSLRGVLNGSVDRFVKDIKGRFNQYKLGRRSRLLRNVPYVNQIYYSVFKNPSQTSKFHLPPEGCAATGPVTQQQFDNIVNSVVDAIEAGVAPKLISQGSSGSYFMYDPNGRIVGVFKPKDEEPYGPLSPKWTKWLHRNLFPCFFGRPCLVPNNGYICESAASLLDRQLLTHIVPFTDIVYLSSSAFYYRFFDRRRFRKGRPLPDKVGSFQLFLHDYEQADVFLKKHPLPDRLHSSTHSDNNNNNNRDNHPHHELQPNGEPVFEWTPEVLDQFREELEKLVILDYIMRNTDRGLDNWMIHIDWVEEELPAEEPLIETDQTTAPPRRTRKVPKLKIGAIDSGLAFPWKHPDEWRSYPFGWLFLPFSLIGQPFSKKTREHFLPMLCSQEWWEESTLAFYHLFSQDSEFQERLWKKQWAVVKGQAFNVVETLKCPEQGPLELVRRTRMMVWDDVMDVPVHVPYSYMEMAIETPMFRPYTDDGDGDDDIRVNHPRQNSYHDLDSFHEEDEDDVVQFPEYVTPSTGSTTLTASSRGDAQSERSRSQSVDSTTRLTVPKPRKRTRGSSLNLEARYRALEQISSEHLFEDLISNAKPTRLPGEANDDEDNTLTDHRVGANNADNGPTSLNVPPTVRRKMSVNDIGFGVAETSQASRKVIVERLQTVTSKPPVFTWC